MASDLRAMDANSQELRLAWRILEGPLEGYSIYLS